MNIKNPLLMQLLVHASREGVMSTFVIVTITATDVLVSHARLMFLLVSGKVSEHGKKIYHLLTRTSIDRIN